MREQHKKGQNSEKKVKRLFFLISPRRTSGNSSGQLRTMSPTTHRSAVAIDCPVSPVNMTPGDKTSN